MPNHVTNIIRMKGSQADLEAIRALMQTPEPGRDDPPDETFNFHQLARCPKELLERTSPFRPQNGETKAEAAQLKDRYIKLHGACEWYDWQVRNWGTKWNAYQVSWDGDDSVRFDTAWSTPEPIFRKLAEKFPEVRFFIAYADEDTGSNCGFIHIQGEKIGWIDASASESATLYAMTIQGREIGSIEELAEDYGYESVEKMDEDYGGTFVENMKSALKEDTPLTELAKRMINGDSGEEIEIFVDSAEKKFEIKRLEE